MVRIVTGERPGSVLLRLDGSGSCLGWEMSVDEALETSERIRVAALRASGKLALVPPLGSKNVGQA